MLLTDCLAVSCRGWSTFMGLLLVLEGSWSVELKISDAVKARLKKSHNSFNDQSPQTESQSKESSCCKTERLKKNVILP